MFLAPSLLVRRPVAAEPPVPTSEDYCMVADANPSSTSWSNDFTVPTPIAGQKFLIKLISEEALSGAPSIGGSTTGVTVRESDPHASGDFVYEIEKDGWEVGTSLNVSFNFSASCTYLALHGWQVVGQNYAADSLLSDAEQASNTNDASVSLTKDADEVAFIGTRRYTSVTSSPSPTEDFAAGNVWAGRIEDGSSFGGTVTATGGSSTFKYLSVSKMEPA